MRITTVATLLVLTSLFMFAGCQSQELPTLPGAPGAPGTTQENTVGQAILGAEAYEVYSEAIDSFEINPEMVTANSANLATLDISVEDTIVYNTGYVYLAEKGWSEFTLQGESASSEWLRADSNDA
jgi:hypothetical protein